jgi:hypothetical protein
VGKSQTFNNFEERTTKPNTVMGRVHLRETEQCTLILPYPRRHLFCPVAGNCIVRILISCLPGIACETYKSSLVTLDRNTYQLNRQPVGDRSLDSHRNSEAQLVHVFLEECNNMLSCRLAVRNIDTFGCPRRNVDHILKGWVIESLYRLNS